MIHCNPVNLLGSEIEESTKITFDVINVFLGLCVPFFFVISGFLFFINVEKLTFKVVIGKWKSRITSLVIPYILWNTLYGIVRIFKAKYLGFDGDGIVVDGSVSMLGFLRGYWDTGDGYPMGFAFWFVRNLIIFVALSPIIYYVARKWITSIIFLCLPALGINCHGLEYFVFGATLGMHRIEFISPVRTYMIISFAIWIPVLVVVQFYFAEALFILRYIGFCLIIYVIRRFDIVFPYSAQLINRYANIYLFIYAIHGMYCLLIDKVWVFSLKPEATFMTLICFILSFLTNVVLSGAILWVVKSVSPRFLNLVSGGRYIKNIRNQ